MDPTPRQWLFLRVLLVWLVFSTSAVLMLNWPNPVHRATVAMGAGLVLFWVVIGGGLMWRFRDPISAYVRSLRIDWRVKFVLFATLLAMLEEAVTTGLTNCAPLFGMRIGQAYITASANYLDVIALHSVSIFVSFFVCWAVVLNWYRFSPFAVFILFGITGTLAEMGFGGPQHALEYAMWTYVYGLMVWLPARSVPAERPARRAPWWLYPVTILLPYLFLLLFPLAGVISIFFPHHPRIHFPPIR